MTLWKITAKGNWNWGKGKVGGNLHSGPDFRGTLLSDLAGLTDQKQEDPSG